MNITTEHVQAANRVRAGSPPSMQLHRAMPIDFVLPDEEAEIRNGFDQSMKAPISTPQHVETASVDDTSADVSTSNFAFWLWGCATWTALWFCLGVVYARHFS